MQVKNSSNTVAWTTDIIADAVGIHQPIKKVDDGIYNANIDQTEKYTFAKPIRKVAIVGAGPAGLPTAKLLLDEGLEVKIYERNSAPGGTWIYHEEQPICPEFPSVIPTKIVRPSLPSNDKPLPFKETKPINSNQVQEELLRLNPPTPCYRSLRNNVPTPLLKYKDLEWKKETPWFTTHDKILEYLQDYASAFKLDQVTEFNTSVEKLEELPNQEGWDVITKHFKYSQDKSMVEVGWKQEKFDAVVVATGHYHAPYIPEFPGLADWRHKWPNNVFHSKQYRVPEHFKGKSVLLIGSGVSAIDIARDIDNQAKTIYNSVRESDHKFDEKYSKIRQEFSKFVPKHVQKVGDIKQFHTIHQTNRIQDGIVELKDGTKLTNLDYIIVCTGYVFNFHFLEHLHSDNYVNANRHTAVDDNHVLVKDGSQVFNLHKDIFYIPNPTLSFVGIPFHIATFSFFEFQSYAVARVYSGSAQLPSQGAMRAEWNEREKRKGSGREFHALGSALEKAYIKDIIIWVNKDAEGQHKRIVEEHSDGWNEIRSQSLIALKKALNISD